MTCIYCHAPDSESEVVGGGGIHLWGRGEARKADEPNEGSRASGSRRSLSHLVDVKHEMRVLKMWGIGGCEGHVRE